MSRRAEDGHQPKAKRRVLEGYQQEGKRFVPPFLQHMGLLETRWMDDRVPELIWIALLIQVFGVQEGTAVAASIAKAAARCDQTAARAYAAASDYRELSREQKRCVRTTLQAENMYAKACQGLAALTNHYAEFPLTFLAEQNRRTKDASVSTLNDLRDAISNISDRLGYAGTFTQATAVYICILNNKCPIPPTSSLANFTAIEEYPVTDESHRVASAIRGVITILLTVETSSSWREAFWNQGRALGTCEVD